MPTSTPLRPADLRSIRRLLRQAAADCAQLAHDAQESDITIPSGKTALESDIDLVMGKLAQVVAILEKE